MEFIGALFIGSIVITLSLGMGFYFVTQFKKWNQGKYYKEEESSNFIISYFITLFVVLIMSYITGKLIWSLLIILIIIAFFKLIFKIHEYQNRK